MSLVEQFKSMNTETLNLNILNGIKINLLPIDLWGGEWWVWLKIKHGNDSILRAVKETLHRYHSS